MEQLRQHSGVTEGVGRGAHVLVTGLPGAGKSTLAKALSAALALPLLAKDELRDILFESLGTTREDPADRARAGIAAVRIQFHLIKTMPSMVVDAGLWTDLSEPDLLATSRPFVQVYCECPFEMARQRVADRDRWDSIVAGSEYERFRPLVEPLRLPHPLIIVPTDVAVDVRLVAEEVQAAMSTAAERSSSPRR